MHCQTGAGGGGGGRVYCSMCALLHLKKKKKIAKMFLCVPHHRLTNSLCYTFLLLNSSSGPQQLFHKEGDSSNYLLTVCFCLKSFPPAPLIAARGEAGEAVCRYCQAQLDRYCQNCQSVVTINILAG